MRPIVIFGSNGMLGSALMRQFSMEQAVGLDFNEVDITDARQIEKKLKEVKPRIVINAAAYNNVDEIEINPESFELAKNINGIAVGEIAKVTSQLEVPLIHFSSEYVFDGKSRAGYLETSIVNPLNKYGETKALGERLMIDHTGEYYLVRLSRMFGAQGSGARTKKSFVDSMLDLVVRQGKTELKVVDEEISCPTYSRDLAKFVYDLLDKEEPYGIYHGANSGTCSWFEFAKAIFEIKKMEVNLIPVSAEEFPRPAKRPMFGELLNTKLPTQRPWREALKDYLK